MPMRLLFLLALCCSLSLTAQSQTPDTIRLDTAQAPVDSISGFRRFFDFKANYPDPKKAAMLSLALPGAGQVYNGRWWKVPLMYAGIGAVIYGIEFNQDRFQRFRVALELKLDGQEHEFSGTNFDNTNFLRAQRDQYDKNVQLLYIGSVIGYAIIAIDAYVDAHLMNFDISEDLSLQVLPGLQPDPLARQPYATVGLILSFK